MINTSRCCKSSKPSNSLQSSNSFPLQEKNMNIQATNCQKNSNDSFPIDESQFLFNDNSKPTDDSNKRKTQHVGGDNNVIKKSKPLHVSHEFLRTDDK